MFGIGFTAGRAIDPDRQDWSGDAARPLVWSAWYPTDDPKMPPKQAETGAPSLFVSQGAVRDAAFSDRRASYPVVLLSHGTGGTAASLAWLAEGLAQQGFVVIGIDHHGNTASEPYRAEGFLCWWERARDLSVILDHHATGPFAGHLDMDRVFASGFSLGGYTATCLLGGITQVPLFSECSRALGWADGPREFPDLGAQVETLLESSPVFRASWERQSMSFRDRRIKAAFVCAPAPTVRGITVESLREITCPVGIAAVGADHEAPSHQCAEWLHRNLANSTFGLLSADAGHYSFLCECSPWAQENEPDICADPPGVNRSAIHGQAIAFAVATFSQ